MSAVEALRLAQENGIRLGVDGADLILDAEREPAQAVLEAIKRKKAEIVALLRPNADGWSADDWRAFFDERADIAGYDGGQSRNEAEALAFDCCVAEWLNRHPSRSDPGHCAACGRLDREGHAVVPFGAELYGHTWLHPECWQGWYEAREADAITALAAMGMENPAKSPDDLGRNGIE
jgi:hypothetical protein